jgi:CRP-like cAMP-binding protein
LAKAKGASKRKLVGRSSAKKAGGEGVGSVLGAGRAPTAEPCAPREPGAGTGKTPSSQAIGIAELRQIPAFARLSDDDAGQILAVAQVCDLARGMLVFDEGQLGLGLYAILSGSVQVIKRNDKGGERILATLDKNEVFGEMDLIGDRVHTTGIRGAEATRLLFIPKTEFQSMLRAGNSGATAMVVYFAVMLAGRLDANNKRMMAVLDEAMPEKRTSEFAEFKRRLLNEWTF